MEIQEIRKEFLEQKEKGLPKTLSLNEATQIHDVEKFFTSHLCIVEGISSARVRQPYYDRLFQAISILKGTKKSKVYRNDSQEPIESVIDFVDNTVEHIVDGDVNNAVNSNVEDVVQDFVEEIVEVSDMNSNIGNEMEVPKEITKEEDKADLDFTKLPNKDNDSALKPNRSFESNKEAKNITEPKIKKEPLPSISVKKIEPKKEDTNSEQMSMF